MATDPRMTVRDWLAAERAGQADEADRLFRRAAAVLPRLQPSAAFADAVLRRAGLVPAALDIWASWWLRVAIATALLSVGVVAVSLSPDAWLAASLSSVRTVAVGLGHGWTMASAWISSALTVWGGLARVSIVLARLLDTPASLLMLALNLTAAGAALVALRRLLPVQEN